jgi:hypothetical protein
VKLAMGAGRGGGISGISITGAGFRGFAVVGLAARAAGFRALAGLRRTGFARRAFAPRAPLRFAFPALRAFRPDFRDARAFAMTAYATVGRVRRQPRRARLEMSFDGPYAALARALV